MIFNALEVKIFGEELEAILINELTGELISLEEVEESESVSVHGKLKLLFLLDQPI
jgi:hypothetical protein